MNWLTRFWPWRPHERTESAPVGSSSCSGETVEHTTVWTPNGAESANQRLARLVRWCTTGQLAAVELELHDWQRHDGCPTAARVLLAALLARRGRIDHALAVLRGATPQELHHDPALGQMRVALLAAEELQSGASRAALRLQREHGRDPAVAGFLAALEIPGCLDTPATSETAAEPLAIELRAHPHVLPSLVAAQRLDADLPTIDLLRQALNLAARDLDQRGYGLPLCQAQAQLALLAGDADDARRWAHRGLRLEPYAAPLALLLAQMRDDLAVGPPARLVLAGALAAQPQYPDLRAALIRRERLDGQTDSAQQRLDQWLAEQPAQPLAHELARELAA